MGNLNCASARDPEVAEDSGKPPQDHAKGGNQPPLVHLVSPPNVNDPVAMRHHISVVAASGPAEVAAQLLSEENPSLLIGVMEALGKQNFSTRAYVRGTAMHKTIAGLHRLLAHADSRVVAASLQSMCRVAKHPKHGARLLEGDVLPEVCRVAGRPDAHRDVVFWAFTLFYHLLRPDGHHVDDDRADLLADAGVTELCADTMALREEDVEIRAQVHEVQRVLA